MSSGEIVLFDLPSKAPGGTWTPNPWKTRLLLNYKSVPYKTEWLEYPDIQPELQKHLAPNANGLPYTIPAVKFLDGTYLMESKQIAVKLEELHPSPSAHLDDPHYLPKVEALWSEVMGALQPIFIPNVPKVILNDASLAYWYETREKWYGGPLDQYAAKMGGAECALDKAAPGIRAVTDLLREKEEGPFFMGGTVSYSDMLWTSVLLFYRRIGSDAFEGILERSGNRQVHIDLLEAMSPWWEKAAM